ncbi:unnamed protein product [Eruca vesicaria subsp. sativa]|uniref:LETM1-like protein n=1 Tax=Eruca vesicaria subsp. sativa TaxID=29727 RepID=A0ABC8KS26_ERUVS|nr:unnamed protein product [Eruca vesicaria subsp. sativa]
MMMMAAKLNQPALLSSSSSTPCQPRIPIVSFVSCKKAMQLDCLSNCLSSSRSQLFVRYGWSRNYKKKKGRRLVQPFLLASAEDGVAVNGSNQSGSSSGVDEVRAKLTGSLQEESYCNGLIQSLHDAARTLEFAVKEKITPPRFSWFSGTWLGGDRDAWLKTLSYQASLYSLLQAVNEISSRGNNRDEDVNVFVQRSLSRQAVPLENMMRDTLSSKHPEAYEWFWSEQVPSVVTSFVNYIEGDQRFLAATSLYSKGKSSAASNEIEVSLLMLVLNSIAAITKLGPAKFSCPPFFSSLPDTTGRLMEKFVDFVPLPQAYHSIKSIGLQREFLTHFGPRAALGRVKGDYATDEVVFWVDLIQKQLQRAIDREKIWSRLTTSESIEVLERDLAIFGFFIALGRSSQSYLAANGFDSLENPLEDLVRHLIGGSVLYYPQLSAISSYQLYVEVVCEELEWIPFYPNSTGAQPPKQSHGHRSKPEGPPNYEAIPEVLDVCSYWLQSFIKHSKWPENPSNVKAAKFLSKGHKSVIRCREELAISKNASSAVRESDSFDKALESVDEALVRLESLLQELYVSNSSSGKEQIKAACSDLEKIRKLKKEAEFLEATFKAKTASLQQEGDKNDSREYYEVQKRYFIGKISKNAISSEDEGKSVSRGFWGFFQPRPKSNPDPELSSGDILGKSSGDLLRMEPEPNEISRFEILRNELMELEMRVKRSTAQSIDDEERISEDPPQSSSRTAGVQLVQISKKENIIEKTLQKLRETTTDVWQGTQLLATDSAAAMQLLRRSLIGDELTEKEKKALRRTMTDLASVIPIGILMLLPVTAVGHAAMLAAIQRYVPGLIPSTYGPERLNLLRQLEKVKELQTNETEPEESIEKIA